MLMQPDGQCARLRAKPVHEDLLLQAPCLLCFPDPLSQTIWGFMSMERIAAPKPAEPLPSRMWSCSELQEGMQHVLADAGAAQDMEEIEAGWGFGSVMKS